MKDISKMMNFMLIMQACAAEYTEEGTITKTVKAFEMNFESMMSLRDFACYGPVEPAEEHKDLHNNLISAFERQLGLSQVVIKAEVIGFNPMEGME
tara:strand:- start:1786 stop:2073 length:288 start_codon:yes stop_codon:yes gene_type:complete